MVFHKLSPSLTCGAVLIGAAAWSAPVAHAQDDQTSVGCAAIDDLLPQSVHTTLEAALDAAAPNQARTGGLGHNMWGTIVDDRGIVCAVANTGEGELNDQWLGSRVISAQKANTGVLFSLNIGAAGIVQTFSSANLYAPTQPGGSLFGLQFSNPVDPAVAYGDNNPGGEETSQGADTVGPSNYATPEDPLVGEYIGGINVFGGGLTLYDAEGNLVGGVGVSGDTSCADHNVAWIVRDTLGLDFVPPDAGVNPNPTAPDNIIYDIAEDGVSESGFGHPVCGLGEEERNPEIVADCPTGDGTTGGCVAD